MEAAGADFAAFFTLAEKDGKYVHTGWVMTGDPASRMHCGLTDGRPFDAHASWDPERPPTRELNRFASLRRSRTAEQMGRVPSWRRSSPVLGVKDMVRMLVYDGPRFVGWVGATRLADRPEYSAGELRALSRTARSVRRALVTCDAAFRLDDADAPASVLLRPDGSVELASEAATDWLDRYGAEALRSQVRRLDRRAGAQETLIGTCRVCITRMVDRVGQATRYLAVIEEARVPHLSALSMLSPRMREVAELAASGATTVEIAEKLGISAETVRTQLKSVYRALGVSNRVQLLAALSRRTPGR